MGSRLGSLARAAVDEAEGEVEVFAGRADGAEFEEVFSGMDACAGLGVPRQASIGDEFEMLGEVLHRGEGDSRVAGVWVVGGMFVASIPGANIQM